MPEKFDVIVIGAGPGGGAAAAACAKAGKKVALIEAAEFGGTCPLRGCNPKKVLVGAAEAVGMAAHLRGRGIAAPPEADWPALVKFERSFVDGKPDRIRKAYDSLGITTVAGRAAFSSPCCVEADGRELSAERFVVACGIRPKPLDIPGGELISSSDDFLKMTELPERIVFVGGGFISFEFAHIAARCGAKATILHRSARVLKNFDPDLTERLITASREAGIRVVTETPLHSVERDGDRLIIRGGRDGGQEFPCDMAVHGAGRVPDIEGLALEKADVAVGPKGIEVNAHMQSISNPRVYAVGDCADTPFALTPTGDMEGKVAAYNILHGNRHTADHSGVPRVVFSVPPLAAVGMLKEEAEAAGIPFDVKETNLAETFSWQRINDRHAYARVLVSTEDDTILGAHVLGHNADEMANLFALAIRLKIPRERLQEVLWVYPTCGYEMRYMI